MTPRTLGALGLALFLIPMGIRAQMATQRLVPAGAEARVQTGSGRIRGRVVAADTGTPLARSQVRLSGAEFPAESTATTDQDGRFEFIRLPASRYTLIVTRSGYVSQSRSLILADTQAAEKIDFALPRGGVIIGRIVDDAGEPVSGIRLQAQRWQYQSDGTRQLVSAGSASPFSAVTDDLGQIRLYGLAPGSYVVSASADALGVVSMSATPVSVYDGSTATRDGFGTTFYPGTANPDEAQAVSIGIGQEVSISFPLTSVRRTRISGIVRNSRGEPVGRAVIGLFSRQGSTISTINGATQPDGSFTIANIPPGEHSVSVGPPRSGAAPAAPAPEDEFASIPITASGQDITGLIITTRPGATISGRLIFDGKSEPPPAETIWVVPSSADPVGRLPPGVTMNSGLADQAGQFQITRVSGRVLFHTAAVRGPSQNWYLKSVALNGVDITDAPLEVKPMTSITGLEVTLTDRQAMLSGAVNNVRGEAVKEFVVVVFPFAPKQMSSAERFTRTIRPDPQGRYEVKGLPPGDYVAAAVESLEPGSQWDPSFQQQLRLRGKAVTLSDGETTTLDLTLSQ